MSQASAQSDARFNASNRDTISGGTLSPWLIGAAVIVAIAALWIFCRKGRL